MYIKEISVLYNPKYNFKLVFSFNEHLFNKKEHISILIIT